MSEIKAKLPHGTAKKINWIGVNRFPEPTPEEKVKLINDFLRFGISSQSVNGERVDPASIVLAEEKPE